MDYPLRIVRTVPFVTETSNLLWLLACSALAGLLIGLRFRVPAALASSAVAALAAVLRGFAADSGIGHALAEAILAVLVLQAGYVGGVVLSSPRRGGPDG